MRLNQASDFALRIAMWLAGQEKGQTIDQISTELGLVKSHTMKICAKLVQADIFCAQRGRNGGIQLARPKNTIFVGEIVRVIEADFAVVECMKRQGSRCSFLPDCRLRQTILKATDSFLAVLDAQNLEDLVVNKT